jgi:small-conductance mechanosensitive channel
MNHYFETLPPWLWSALLLLGLIGVGLIAHALLFWLIARVAARTRRFSHGFFLKHARAPARVLIPLLLVSMTLPDLPLSPRAMDILERAVAMAFIGAVAWLVIALLEGLEDIIAARYPTDMVDNLIARRIRTQAHLLQRVAVTVVLVIAAALILMKFPSIAHLGTSLLASAGLAGIAAGIAARPMLSNLIAGIQLALTEPIRIEDAVVVEGEFGNIEEITTTYVVVRLWDMRRMILPLTYFIEHPFQNWTLTSADLIGTVLVHVDYTVPVEEVRLELKRILDAAPLWDQRVWNLQVTDANDKGLQLRAMMSARNAGQLWDLRVYVREKLLVFLQQRYPQALPRVRTEVSRCCMVYRARRPPHELAVRRLRVSDQKIFGISIPNRLVERRPSAQ